MPLTVFLWTPSVFMCVRSGVQKPIAQEVAHFIGKHRAIWSGHRRQDRELIASSLKNGNWDGSFNEKRMADSGINAWEWILEIADNQEKAAVALFSIHGLPHNSEKKDLKPKTLHSNVSCGG